MSAELKAITVASLAAAATVTANGNRAAFDLRPFDGETKLSLNCDAGGGTNPTLDVKIQHSADGSTNWTDSGVAFSQVTGTASFQVLTVSAEQFKRYIRVVDTVGGTNPTFARSVGLVARRRA